MWVRKDKPGTSSGPDGGYLWERAGDVIEVLDHIGEELLAIAGFSEAEPPKQSQKSAAKDDAEADDDQPAKRRPGRPRKQVAEAPSGEGDAAADSAQE